MFDIERKEARIASIEHDASQPDFWNEQQKAQAILKEKSQLESVLGDFKKASSTLDDAQVMFELADAEKDESARAEAEGQLKDAQTRIEKLEFQRMLSGPNDRANAIVDINAGAGGTESMDWAQMLLRMYARYAEKKGWKVEMTDATPGEEAGFKSVSFVVEGEYAFGFLKAENGVHRLVRISPFDAQARRQTSFTSVFVYPQVADDIEIDIQDKDVKREAIRASGAGGQKVNKTSSAIRLTHLPTGIQVHVQTERSQNANEKTAWTLLRSRLYEIEVKKREAEKAEVEAGKKDIGFGSQIRSYVLAPYQMVKDHRTGIESGNPSAVLDGDLDKFIEAQLLGVKNPNRPSE
ncbi:MAG: peptide chain release factor 2 [Deltaproteobacteria bacterium]|nr:peptide chain release factor 2 [Deltaproteobacteria bacterium]